MEIKLFLLRQNHFDVIYSNILFVYIIYIIHIILAEVVDACNNNYMILVVFMLIAQVYFSGIKSMVYGSNAIRLIVKESLEMRNE